MIYENDNVESRSEQLDRTLTNGDLVSQAYSGLAELNQQQRANRQSGSAVDSTTNQLIMSDPYSAIAPTTRPRMEREQPVPVTPPQVDHETARRRAEAADQLAQERLRYTGRRRQRGHRH